MKFPHPIGRLEFITFVFTTNNTNQIHPKATTVQKHSHLDYNGNLIINCFESISLDLIVTQMNDRGVLMAYFSHVKRK